MCRPRGRARLRRGRGVEPYTIREMVYLGVRAVSDTKDSKGQQDDVRANALAAAGKRKLPLGAPVKAKWKATYLSRGYDPEYADAVAQLQAWNVQNATDREWMPYIRHWETTYEKAKKSDETNGTTTEVEKVKAIARRELAMFRSGKFR